MHFIVIYFLCIYDLLITFFKPLYIQMMSGLIFSIVIWYLMNSKIVHLKKLFSKMKSMQLHKEFESIQLKIINSTLIIILLFQIVIVMLEVYYFEYGESWHQKMFTFNTMFDTNIKIILSRSFLYTTYFMTFYQFPMIVKFFCCLLYYQLSTSIFTFFQTTKNRVLQKFYH